MEDIRPIRVKLEDLHLMFQPYSQATLQARRTVPVVPKVETGGSGMEIEAKVEVNNEMNPSG